jgi:hypothetical protein
MEIIAVSAVVGAVAFGLGIACGSPSLKAIAFGDEHQAVDQRREGF